MNKYLLLISIILLTSCGNTEFTVGSCKEYSSTVRCPTIQIELNRNMIDKCVVRGGLYTVCVNEIQNVGCIQDKYVICRQNENEFISYSSKSTKIQGNKHVGSVQGVITSTLPTQNDSTNNIKDSWYDEGDTK